MAANAAFTASRTKGFCLTKTASPLMARGERSEPVPAPAGAGLRLGETSAGALVDAGARPVVGAVGAADAADPAAARPPGPEVASGAT